MIFFGGLPGYACETSRTSSSISPSRPRPTLRCIPATGSRPSRWRPTSRTDGVHWDEPWPTIRLDAGQHVPARELHSAVPRWPAVRVRRGIFDADEARYPGTNETQMFFHYRYLYEATRQRVGVGTFMVQVTDPERAAAVALAIDDAFENSHFHRQRPNRGSVRPELAELAGNLVALLNGIGLAVAFTVLLVTANTMSMAVRERRAEIAVLKTLGFSSGRVMGLILTEALVLALSAGLLGTGWPAWQGQRGKHPVPRRHARAVSGPAVVARARRHHDRFFARAWPRGGIHAGVDGLPRADCGYVASGVGTKNKERRTDRRTTNQEQELGGIALRSRSISVLRYWFWRSMFRSSCSRSWFGSSFFVLCSSFASSSWHYRLAITFAT